MMRSTLKWTAAIAFSLLAHAGAATLFEAQPEKEQAEIAGGEAMEVTLLGNAFEDTLQAGDPSEPLEPMEEQPEQVEPILPETAAVVPEEVTPIQSEIAAEAPSDIPPVEADIILPADEIPPVAVAEAEVTATVPPVETVVPEEKPEQKPEPQKVEKPKKKPEPKKEKPVKKKVVARKTGDAGANAASQNKGQADGAENAKVSTSQGKKGAQSRQSGNAATSNYQGKVRSKLQRALKYPRAADRNDVRGAPWVRFTVSASGAVSGVSVAKSSGSSLLDQAVINAVNRASPFPPIPEAVGKSTWTFTIPLSFTR
jgi:protein TonB